jgi:CheY-like chemotaxis protein
MTLSSMVVSRDWQEVSVLECILGGLHIGVDVVSDADRARAKLAKSKIDAVIIDCDLRGTTSFLTAVQAQQQNSVPLVIVSGSSGRHQLEATGASFVFEKPISVEQAVHTLSAARNMIMDGRLHYHRQSLEVPVSLSCGPKTQLEAQLTNISQGGAGVRSNSPLPACTPVRLSFDLPGTKQAVKLLGKVAWMDKEGNAGIRFVQIPRRTKRDLQLWLERQYFVGR